MRSTAGVVVITTVSLWRMLRGNSSSNAVVMLIVVFMIIVQMSVHSIARVIVLCVIAV